MSKNQNSNNNLFIGLDLSLNGSQINPSGNIFASTSTPKKLNTNRSDATSSSTYLAHRTTSVEAKRQDSSRSVNKNVSKANRSSLYNQKPTTPRSQIKPKKQEINIEQSTSNEAKQSAVFNILTSRSSFDDNSNYNNFNGRANKTSVESNFDGEKKPTRQIGFSMFLADDSVKVSTRSPHVHPDQRHQYSTAYKDSLDAPLTTSNTNESNDEAWKNEMFIYEKYLKEDYERFETNYLNDFEPVGQNTQLPADSGIGSSGIKRAPNKMKVFHENIQNGHKDGQTLGLSESKQTIEKLQSSVDTLRRDLHNDIQTNDTKFQAGILNDLKRKLAARKIQDWYRRHYLRKKTGEAALKRLMAQKKEEMINREKGDKEKKLAQLLADKQKKEEKAAELRKLRLKEFQKKNDEPKPEKKITPRPVPNINVADTQPTATTKQTVTPKDPVVYSEPTPIESIKTEILSNGTTQSFNNTDIKSLDNSVKSKTLDDLFEAMKELEKVDKFPTPPNTDKSFLSDSTTTLTDATPDARKSKNAFDDMKNTASLTNQKLNSILSFLDDVDTESHQTASTTTREKQKTKLNNSRNQVEKKNKTHIDKFFEHELENPEVNTMTPRSGTTRNKPPVVPMPMVPSAEDIENLEKASQAAAEVTNTMLSNRLELEEKKRTISMLQKALNQQRELTIRHTKETEKELEARFTMQKQEYEATIQRHLNFIDQLIDDKKTLGEKCEKLVRELKDVEKKYGDRIRSLEENFKVETTKIKEMHEAAERIRREKWIDEKTKKIKEMTVKGLEPEIQNLISKHKNEVKTLKAIHEAELLQADERAAQRYIRMTEELRENYEREKEASIVKERELSKQRYEKSIQDEERSYLEQRRRLYAEVEEEKNRVAEQATKQRHELDKLRKALEENNLHAIEGMRKEYEASRTEQERRHLNEIKDLKERLDIEKQTWEDNYIKKQESTFSQKEREMRDKLRNERDKEIELVIARLEAETTTSREETERAAENRVKRIRDKYETELKEVEKTERETTERYNTLKARYNELEGNFERNKVVLKQKDKELEDIHKITETLQQERSRLADIIRQEFSDRLVFTEEESKRIKLEIAEIKSKHHYELQKKQEEIEKLQREKEDELSKVHDRIKQAISKKEESVNQLKQQYDAACKRADHLEGLLEQQRKLMLAKK